MYIGPQGIVHGTTITIMNAARRKGRENISGQIFVTSGLGGMSGAQGKASVIAGAIGIIAEINPKATQKRFEQGWEIKNRQAALMNAACLFNMGNKKINSAYKKPKKSLQTSKVYLCLAKSRL